MARQRNLFRGLPRLRRLELSAHDGRRGLQVAPHKRRIENQVLGQGLQDQDSPTSRVLRARELGQSSSELGQCREESWGSVSAADEHRGSVHAVCATSVSQLLGAAVQQWRTVRPRRCPGQHIEALCEVQVSAGV